MYTVGVGPRRSAPPFVVKLLNCNVPALIVTEPVDIVLATLTFANPLPVLIIEPIPDKRPLNVIGPDTQLILLFPGLNLISLLIVLFLHLHSLHTHPLL